MSFLWRSNTVRDGQEAHSSPIWIIGHMGTMVSALQNLSAHQEEVLLLHTIQTYCKIEFSIIKYRGQICISLQFKRHLFSLETLLIFFRQIMLLHQAVEALISNTKVAPLVYKLNQNSYLRKETQQVSLEKCLEGKVQNLWLTLLHEQKLQVVRKIRLQNQIMDL